MVRSGTGRFGQSANSFSCCFENGSRSCEGRIDRRMGSNFLIDVIKSKNSQVQRYAKLFNIIIDYRVGGFGLIRILGALPKLHKSGFHLSVKKWIPAFVGIVFFMKRPEICHEPFSRCFSAAGIFSNDLGRPLFWPRDLDFNRDPGCKTGCNGCGSTNNVAEKCNWVAIACQRQGAATNYTARERSAEQAKGQAVPVFHPETLPARAQVVEAFPS